MTKKFEHFVHTMDFTPGKNLVWDFLDCKECHKNSLHKNGVTKVVKKSEEFKLCDRCSQEIESLKKYETKAA